MINEQIRDREVRLIGENGEQLGIMSARDAMKLAKEANLDLVKKREGSKEEAEGYGSERNQTFAEH